MLKILNIISQFKEYFLLIICILISLILLTINDNKQIKYIRSYTVAFLGLTQSTLSVIPNIFELHRENETLRKLNVILSDEVSRLREAKLENIHLREMLEYKERSEFNLISADVVGKTLYLLRNTITLNVGEKDGIIIDMPIISEKGIVGKIIAVSSDYSLGQLIINKDFRASVKIQRSRVDGILAWEGKDYLELKNVSKKQDVIVGDNVITSGYSRIYPPNIKVGVVSHVSEDTLSLFKNIQVKSNVDFTKLEQVFVIKIPADSQRIKIESNIDKLK